MTDRLTESEWEARRIYYGLCAKAKLAKPEDQDRAWIAVKEAEKAWRDETRKRETKGFG